MQLCGGAANDVAAEGGREVALLALETLLYLGVTMCSKWEERGWEGEIKP
jgi:hypothetical protein